MGTKGLALKVAIIAVAIIVNSAVVVYFARDSFDLPNWLNQLSLTLNDDIAIKPPTNEVGNEFDQASQTMPPPEVPKRVFEHAHSYATRCIDKKKPPDTKRLYTWLDKNGIRHISDKPRVLDGSTVVEIAGTIEPETISLNFLTHNLSYDVQSALQNRVTHAMRAFASITPKESIVPVVANIRSFEDKAAYQKHVSKLDEAHATSAGLYTANNNESAVLIRGTAETINTVVHEVMHTINRHWYGQMTRWMNEGMAEFAEAPNSTNKSSWKRYFATNSPVPLTTLFNGTELNWQNEKQKYYATSWAFVTFLMTEHREFMSRLLLKETENGCQMLTIEDVVHLYGGSIAQLQNDFNRWVRKALV
ncbi:MAG: hypothetical protein AXW14_03820 [Alteromonas sp. Nap_26]|nr:MAG: hypothetical protein AXW14_03820 [Alteromonas sp. Nap_26]